MNPIGQRHESLTAVRAEAYKDLLGCKPSTIFPPTALFKKPDERFLIDIFVYPQETQWGDIEVAVTNGMSDQLIAQAAYPTE
jgi:hypothetical protein